MRKMFCIKCNSPAFEGSNFCQKCLSEQHELFKVKSKVIKSCDTCKLYEVNGNDWQEFESMDDAALYIAKQSIDTKGEIKRITVKMKKAGNVYHVDLICTGTLDVVGADKPLELTEKRGMSIRFRKHKCDICAKLSGNYFEAILQLRGPNAEELLELVKKISEERMITKIEEKKEGWNVYIVFKSYAKNLVSLLKRRRAIHSVKKSYKFKGEKKTIKLYRDYYALR